MARPSRYNIIGHAQNIIHLGHNRDALFQCCNDYNYYLTKLDNAAIANDVKIHAYILLNNHIHILVTPYTSHGVSKMMQMIGSAYSKYYNKKYCRTGTVFNGRYKSSLVDSKKYLLECYKYIEQNSSRINNDVSLDNYLWSSWHHNALGTKDHIITEHEIYKSLGVTARERASAYRKLASVLLDPDTLNTIRRLTNTSWVIGSPSYQKEIQSVYNIKTAPKQKGGDRRSGSRNNSDRRLGNNKGIADTKL